MAHQDYHQGAHNIHHLHLPYRLLWVFPTLNVKDLSLSSVLWSHFAESVSLQGSLAKAFWRCGESGTGGRSRIIRRLLTIIIINKQVPDMWKWFTDEDGFVDKLYEENWSSSTVAFLCSNNISITFLTTTKDERYHFLDCPNGIDNDDDNTV